MPEYRLSEDTADALRRWRQEREGQQSQPASLTKGSPVVHQYCKATATSASNGALTAGKLIRYTGTTPTEYEACWMVNPGGKLTINLTYFGQWGGVHTDGKVIVICLPHPVGPAVTQQLLADVTISTTVNCAVSPPTVTVTPTKTFVTGTFVPGTTFA